MTPPPKTDISAAARALKPFAEHPYAEANRYPDSDIAYAALSIGDFRRARAALKKAGAL